MQGYLYRNKSDTIKLDKTLENQTPVTLYFKEDSSIINPVFTISRSINMTGLNYLEVPVLHRYYYINDVTLSKQYYIISCTVDVLMSFKTQIRQENAIIAKNAVLFDEYLEDDRFKAEQYTHRDTYLFEGGFTEEVQNFILVVCGNPAVSASVGDGQSNNGGSSRPSQNISPQDYEDLPESQKDNNDIYIIDETKPVGSLPDYEQQTKYWFLTEAQYNALSNTQQNDGTMYFISANGTNIKGTRNIFLNKTQYTNLGSRDKNNNIPYYITDLPGIKINDELMTGSILKANPVTVPTDTLSKIKINGTTYSIGG